MEVLKSASGSPKSVDELGNFLGIEMLVVKLLLDCIQESCVPLPYGPSGILASEKVCYTLLGGP